jgi:hypothetical protein
VGIDLSNQENRLSLSLALGHTRDGSILFYVLCLHSAPRAHITELLLSSEMLVFFSKQHRTRPADQFVTAHSLEGEKWRFGDAEHAACHLPRAHHTNSLARDNSAYAKSVFLFVQRASS